MSPPLLVLTAVILISAVGCATSRYKVPGDEVQRLVQLPAPERDRIRVVPWNRETPLPAAVAPAPAAGAAYEDAAVVGAVWDPTIVVEVPVPAPRAHSAYALGPSWRGSPSAAGSGGGGWRGSPPAGSGGGWRGSPPATSGGGGWRGTSPSSGRSAVPRSTGGRGGGGGSNTGAIVAGAVVAVAAVALIAVAANAAEAEAQAAAVFDGWVRVPTSRRLHLVYLNGAERSVPVSALGPNDLVGLAYAFLSGADGPITPLGGAAAAH